MLVCNVSLLRRRASIAAELAEAASALDAPGTGNVVFATLIDDPASVGDRVDAYLGNIMVEAASAASTVNAAVIYAAAVVEAVTAADVCRLPMVLSGAVVEAATAADVWSLPAILSATVAEVAAAVSAQDAERLVVVLARTAVVAGLEPISVSSKSGARQLRSGTMVVSSALPAVYAPAMFESAAAAAAQNAAVNGPPIPPP